MPTYTLYGASYANGDSVSKSDVENGTGSAVDTFSRSGSTLSSVLTGAPALTTAIANADMAIFIRETDASVESNLYSENVGAITVASAFTPADLFGVGDVGAWYDIHPDYCFTDTARTTNAAVGDAVAAVEDRSGSGNHLTQATASNRAILRQSGSLYYLETDGVDDEYITSPGVFGGAATVFSMAFAGTYGSDANSTRNFALGNITGGTATAGAAETFGPAADETVRFDGATTSAGSQTITLNVPLVRVSTRNGSAITDRIDGVSSLSTTVSGLASTIDEIAVAARISGASVCNFYGAVVIDRLITSGETSDLETFLAAKSGVTL